MHGGHSAAISTPFVVFYFRYSPIVLHCFVWFVVVVAVVHWSLSSFFDRTAIFLNTLYGFLMFFFLSVEYFIAASCKHVQCPIGQHCLEDQNLMPHCVTCSITCPPYDPAVKSTVANPSRLVCGVDGNTYRNLCEIKRTACELGRSIPVAYRGACKGK